MNISTRASGSQAVYRALLLLKLVGQHHENGIPLKDLVEKTALDRTTAYRLLSCLVDTEMLERDNRKRYRLGVAAMQLGLRSMSRVPILERCKPVMIRLARRTEDTVYIVVRNGDYAHCIHYEEGSFPIKALVLQIDGLRLLGVGSAGTALLSTLSDAEISEFHARQHTELPRTRAKQPALMREMREIRQRGYASTENLVAEGVSGVGVCFEISPGYHAALSVGAIRSRMPPERVKWIAQIMRDELAASGLILQPVGK